MTGKYVPRRRVQGGRLRLPSPWPALRAEGVGMTRPPAIPALLREPPDDCAVTYRRMFMNCPSAFGPTGPAPADQDLGSPAVVSRGGSMRISEGAKPIPGARAVLVGVSGAEKPPASGDAMQRGETPWRTAERSRHRRADRRIRTHQINRTRPWGRQGDVGVRVPLGSEHKSRFRVKRGWPTSPQCSLSGSAISDRPLSIPRG